MHVRRLGSLALLSFVACTPTTPPVDRARVQEAPDAPAEVEPAEVERAKVEPAPAIAVTPTPASPAVPSTPAVDSIDETPREPAAPGKSPVASKRFPDNVYAALVDPQGRWSVDIIDFEYVEGSPLAMAIGRGETPEEQGIDDIPAGDAALPVGWAVGDAWTLMTRKGTVSKRVDGFAANISQGSGVLHFHVRLGAAPRGAKGPAIAMRRRAGADAPQLAAPVTVPLATLGDDALTKITAALPSKLDAEQRATLRKYPLTAKDVEVYAGRFPGDRTHAIVVRTVPPGDDAAVSGVLFAKADGTIEVMTISDVWGQIEMFAIADLDADGTDELIYEDAYHEGWYLQMLYWKQGSPKIRVLTGDGV